MPGESRHRGGRDAAIQGSDSQLYPPVFSGLAAGTNFSNGDFSLTPESTEVGWVTFELPDG